MEQSRKNEQFDPTTNKTFNLVSNQYHGHIVILIDVERKHQYVHRNDYVKRLLQFFLHLYSRAEFLKLWSAKK